MKVIDDALLAEFRNRARCEFCQRPCRTGLDPHHLMARGRGSAFRMDLRINLAALCRLCHRRVHAGEISQAELLAVVAKREGRDVNEMEEELRRMRWK